MVYLLHQKAVSSEREEKGRRTNSFISGSSVNMQANMQRSSSKTSSSSSVQSLLGGSSPELYSQQQWSSSFERVGTLKFDKDGLHSSSESLRRGMMPDHSPFTPHPALQLGNSNESVTLGGKTFSPVMPHYKNTLGLGQQMLHQQTKSGDSSYDSFSSERTQQKKNQPLLAEKEALLLEYYWSHYWSRSMP